MKGRGMGTEDGEQRAKGRGRRIEGEQGREEWKKGKKSEMKNEGGRTHWRLGWETQSMLKAAKYPGIERKDKA